MNVRTVHAVIILALLAPPVCTASSQAGTAFQISASESSVLIRVGAAGLFGFFGHAHEVAAKVMEGTVVVDRVELTRSTVAIEFPSSALKVTGTGEPAADVPEVQRVMQSDQVLDVARYPSIRFRSRQIVTGREAAGRIPVVVRGDLTLRGVTRPVEVTGTIVLTDDVLTIQGKARIRQTEFGLHPVTVAGGTVRVKDQLDVELVIVARAGGERGGG